MLGRRQSDLQMCWGQGFFYVNVHHATPQGHLLQEDFPDLKPD